MDSWGCKQEPEAGNEQIPQGRQPGSDFPRWGLYALPPQRAGHSTITKNQPKGAPFNFFNALKEFTWLLVLHFL